jgi:hypothetical protein
LFHDGHSKNFLQFSYDPGACTIKLYGFVIYEKWPNFATS